MKKILFITGTRADFGKQKTILKSITEHPDFDCTIFCTGMHLMSKYGNTVVEIQKAGFKDQLFYFINQVEGESMEVILSNTISGLSKYVQENKVDLIVIHGDRVESLAGAIVGALRNILVAHIEGGEVSGTIDDLIRHACTKMSHIHFVASEMAKKRLLQLGENENSIYNIGSPDVDVMLSNDLPDIEKVKSYYEIEFDDFAIAMLHPVTSELDVAEKHATIFVDSLLESNQNYVVIYPNNDLGNEHILNAYKKLKSNPRIKIFPSLRFEYFLTLLKYSKFIIGNSSAGIHEAPVYGVPTINVGTRQNNRFNYVSISNVAFDSEEILKSIRNAQTKEQRYQTTDHYGKGNSAQLFVEAINVPSFWLNSVQKTFVDLK
ncbi:UDP-N-acetylglucosamine 2-epimerase [Flavobacterium cheonanense]|uniref:UDP-N-acetylglucosamine 2-epimerase n=1 Tax=Flavobacterium cheonanense TaxID=706183 RepID=A0ABP7W4X6_9FLAO